MRHHSALEHGAVHASGIEAQIRQIVGRFDIEQGGQGANARPEIDKGTAAEVAKEFLSSFK